LGIKVYPQGVSSFLPTLFGHKGIPAGVSKIGRFIGTCLIM
jgi:hypothetical protein